MTKTVDDISEWLRNFIRQDTSSGILFIIAAVLAMVLENSPFKWLYDALLSTPVRFASARYSCISLCYCGSTMA